MISSADKHRYFSEFLLGSSRMTSFSASSDSHKWRETIPAASCAAQASVQVRFSSLFLQCASSVTCSDLRSRMHLQKLQKAPNTWRVTTFSHTFFSFNIFSSMEYSEIKKMADESIFFSTK